MLTKEPRRRRDWRVRVVKEKPAMGRKRKTRVFKGEDIEEVIGEEEVQMERNDGSSEDKEKSLYKILGIEKAATHQEIKKAYHKLALRLHPDKNPGDEESKEKFQLLQKVMSILGDEEKRAIYDETGCVDDTELAGESVNNLREYFRSIYKTVTVADIEEFEANYRGSDTEKKDLKDLYKEFKGNMNRLFSAMICSEPKLDSHRFKDIIDEAIAEGEIKATKAYEKWAKVISEIKPPTNPVACRNKTKKKPETDLVAIITQRRFQRKEQFESMFSSIIAKADGESSGEPTEEEFQRARQRLEKKASRKGKH